MKNFKIYFLILFFSIGALEVNAGGGHNHGGAETLLPLNLRGEARSSLYQFTVVYQEILNGSEGHSAEEGHDDHGCGFRTSRRMCIFPANETIANEILGV